MRRRLDLCAVLLGVSAALLASAGVHSAQADNFGGPKNSAPSVCNTTNYEHQQCVAENWLHEVNYNSGLVTIWRTALEDTRSDYDPNSDITLIMDDTYGDNDVRAANVTDSGENFWAWTRCPSTPDDTGSLPTAVPAYANGLYWCKPQLIYFNRAHEDIYNTAAKRKAVACHELGHTMGLRHRDTAGATGLSCMRSTPRIGSTWYTVPTGHDLGLLDYWYN
jgi:hypothetical protein